MRKTALGTFAAVAASAALSTIAAAAGTGIQFIGAAHAAPENLRVVADELAAVRGDTQVSMLPFEFNPDAASRFAGATALVQSVLPRTSAGETFTITIYLEWFNHDAPGNAAQNEFWGAWGAARPTARQQTLRNNYLSRVGEFDRWVAATRAWAHDRRLDSRFIAVAVPVLEDTLSPSERGAYTNLVAALRQKQQADAVAATPMRRSCVPEAYFRVSGLALEMHGPWADARRFLTAGDLWSPDGTTINDVAVYISNVNDALSRGVSALAWREVYNGHPHSNPWPQRTVDPFTNIVTGGAERTYLHRAMTRR